MNDESKLAPFATGVPFAIAKAEAFVLRSPCEVPVRTSFGTMHDRPAVFVRLTGDDGTIGLGEVWCNFPACGAEHRARLLETGIFPALLEQGAQTPENHFDRLSKRFERLAIQAGEAGPIAQCIAGIDLALWDIAARRGGQPLWRLLGGDSGSIGTYASGINPAGAVHTVARCRAEGHTAFKLKIGFGDETDNGNLSAIRTEMNAGESLMADANQAWTLREALDHLPTLAGFGLSWLEEPILATQPKAEWRKLAANSAIPIAAGENIMGTDDFSAAIGGDWLGVIQPDICKWGGISATLPVAQSIKRSGKRYCPHFLGGGIGLMASAHLLAGVGGDGLLEIDSNNNPLRSNLFAPMIECGHIHLGEARGIGISPDRFDAFLQNRRGFEVTSKVELER